MSQLSFDLEILESPTNQMAHLLRDMINGKMIAEQNYKYNRFRGSISDLILEYNCPIRHKDVDFYNSFGRKSYYRKHYILLIDKDQAIEIYRKINTVP